MTVIVWDGQILAADRQITRGLTRYTGTKIWREGGIVLAGTGQLDRVLMLKDWYLKGAKLSEYPEFQRNPDTTATLVVATALGAAAFEMLPVPLEAPSLCAWGAGSEFAMGALHAGVDARRAALIASGLCEGCGGGVDAFDVGANYGF